MKRREVLKASLAATLLGGGVSGLARAAARTGRPGSMTWSRVRPGGAGWPGAAEWDQLRRATSGRLQKLASPFAACVADAAADGASCTVLREQIKNPFFVGDHPALTQTSGWQD